MQGVMLAAAECLIPIARACLGPCREICWLLCVTQAGITCTAMQASVLHWLPAVPWVLQRDWPTALRRG